MFDLELSIPGSLEFDRLKKEQKKIKWEGYTREEDGAEAKA